MISMGTAKDKKDDVLFKTLPVAVTAAVPSLVEGVSSAHQGAKTGEALSHVRAKRTRRLVHSVAH